MWRGAWTLRARLSNASLAMPDVVAEEVVYLHACYLRTDLRDLGEALRTLNQATALDARLAIIGRRTRQPEL